MARAKIQLCEDDVKDLAKIGCTYQEIASIVGCSVDTLVRQYKEVIQSGHEDMKASLRRQRLAIALNPEHKQQAAMLIFLSKVILGDKEYEVIDDGRNAPKITVEFVAPDKNK